ncbi:MAG: TonB-dependent receptor [Flavobacteriales bacterium]|nr:TonB-dependent receptor [Flavobacteriales bacterium]
MRTLFLTLLLSFCWTLTHAQARVSGTISDSLSGVPIIGAYIFLKSDFSIGAASDISGNYKLDLPEGNHTLIFKSTGMENDTFNISLGKGQNLVLNVAMKERTLNTVDVTVGKFDQKVEELTYSMEVIKPALIENKNTRSIESILDQTPGLNIMDGEPQIRGGSGFTFGVGSKVAVLVDDMPILSGDAGRPEWGFVPVENIEQIEVTKGASSVLSGSSALSGVIHIRTSYPKAKPQTKINVYSGYYSAPENDSAKWWGNNDTTTVPAYRSYAFIHGVNFLHSRIIKKNLDLVIGGNFNWDHGYIGAPIKGPEVVDTISEDFTDKQMEQQKMRLNFNLRHRSKRFKGLQYGLNGNFMYHKTNLVLAWLDDSSGIYRGYPGAVLLQNQTIFNLDPYIEFYSKVGVKHSLRTRFLYTDNDMSGNQSNLSRVYYADYQFKKEFNFLKDKSFDFIGGVSSQFNDSYAQIYSGGGDSTNQLFNLSGYAEIQKDFFKVLNFSLGARAEYFRLNDTLTAWNPIFRSGVNLKLSQATFLRASYGQGFRFPTITERYISTAVGSFGVYANPELKPERSWNAEVGVNQGFKIRKYLGQIDVAAFLQRYENTIEYLFGFWDPSPDFSGNEPIAGFKFLNTGKSEVSGFDITLNGGGKIGKHFKFTHMLGYNYINPITLEPDLVFAEDFNFANPGEFSFRKTSYDTTTNVLKYRFKHTFKADVELSYRGFSVGYTAKYFSKMENLDRAIIDFENVTVLSGGTLQAVLFEDFYNENNNGNLIMDLRASYEYGNQLKHKISVVVKNLMNRTYSLRPLKIEPMRSVVFQYTFKF